VCFLGVNIMLFVGCIPSLILLCFLVPSYLLTIILSLSFATSILTIVYVGWWVVVEESIQAMLIIYIYIYILMNHVFTSICVVFLALRVSSIDLDARHAYSPPKSRRSWVRLSCSLGLQFTLLTIWIIEKYLVGFPRSFL